MQNTDAGTTTRELDVREMAAIYGGEDGGGGFWWDYSWVVPVVKAVVTAVTSSSDEPYCGYACGKGA
ncbi:MAG TPA: hypothetical protein VFH27_07730 [Longimicrobiaceae bacterium]|nr:hypothetical protein [Longimicrobiaceae bacterium]